MTLQKRIFTLSLCLAALALPATVQAFPKGDKAGNGGKRGVRKALIQYDANHNGVIDGDEIAAVRTAFDADKTGPLSHLDTNADGKLEDAEITGALKPRAGGKGKKNNA